METFTFKSKDGEGTVEVPVADAGGRAIKEGSVLVEVDVQHEGNTPGRGVVCHITRPGDMSFTMMDSIGDLKIYLSAGHTRVTNRYSAWAHVPEEDQTYEERYRSWLYTPYEHDVYGPWGKCPEAGMLADGLLALLPPDTIGWDYGPWPDDTEQLLGILMGHIDELSGGAETREAELVAEVAKLRVQNERLTKLLCEEQDRLRGTWRPALMGALTKPDEDVLSKTISGMALDAREEEE